MFFQPFQLELYMTASQCGESESLIHLYFIIIKYKA